MKRIVVITSSRSVYDTISENLFYENAPVSSDTGIVGVCGDCKVSVLLSEMGKVNVAMSATRIVREVSPHAIFSVGMAKSLTNTLMPGSVVVGSHFCYYDVCFGGSVEYGRYPGEPSYYHSNDDIVSRMIDVGLSVHQGLVVSGDKVVDNKSFARKIANHFNKARALDVDSAVVAQVCHKSKTPFVSIRVIDDVPVMEEKAKSLYPQFKQPADAGALARKLFLVLNKTMESL